jgi:hypothetical protein
VAWARWHRRRGARIATLHLGALPDPAAHRGAVWIDALFGTGLERPLSGAALQWVAAMNGAAGRKLAVDVPSGSGVVAGGFRCDGHAEHDQEDSGRRPPRVMCTEGAQTGVNDHVGEERRQQTTIEEAHVTAPPVAGGPGSPSPKLASTSILPTMLSLSPSRCSAGTHHSV